MISTPICDFVRQYAESSPLRLHMPGHKGAPLLGFEPLDLTEIHGADSLYEAEGIIRESEANASRLFGCPTFYSAEGSSLCIRAMAWLTLLCGKAAGRPPLLWAGRNAHKTLLSAAALLGLEIKWLSSPRSSYLACPVDPEALDREFSQAETLPAALYLTSPDYLGNLADIGAISRVCRRHGVLLAVDNAHGAYLRFLSPSQHPIDLGADLCCDSAHKTLPVVTGGAYLHIGPQAPALLKDQARNALALFGSTSPSYLILQSLDRCNRYLTEGYPERLTRFAAQVRAVKDRLAARGWVFQGGEDLKLTIAAKRSGYTGDALAALLEAQGIYCEFCDPDYLVLMVTPETGRSGLSRLEAALDAIPRRDPILQGPPPFSAAERVCSIREAALSPSVTLPVDACLGRILAAASVGCPPAVPILMCGERIGRAQLDCFHYYGIEFCTVMA